jgi:hypothetical protein
MYAICRKAAGEPGGDPGRPQDEETDGLILFASSGDAPVAFSSFSTRSRNRLRLADSNDPSGHRIRYRALGIPVSTNPVCQKNERGDRPD